MRWEVVGWGALALLLFAAEALAPGAFMPVSYTHLTLPTILRV